MNTADSNNKSVELYEGWPRIRQVCEKVFKDKINVIAKSVKDVLHFFNKLLGSNKKSEIESDSTESEAHRLFVLGHAKNMVFSKGCHGAHKHNQQGDSGLCVNYCGVSSLHVGIVWQTYILEAQKPPEAKDKHVTKAQQLSSMIKKLKESAEESYRNSNHNSMIWPLDKASKKITFLDFLMFFVCLI
ncbi:unnamed protein product [Trypanosoma congolense IL3000]|uniref:WGS project CAEQ00000000 data, annotated contig 419 n=1 Tax=Trypanosoma congolense (strain IL3000) TaxID=1068625 RepID=F9WFR4_TRYCI|nr:unnamed protein product [Trypanosoma congolense IL3000]